MKTQLVDAIQLQEVELEEEINTNSSNNTPAEASEAKGEEHKQSTCVYTTLLVSSQVASNHLN